MRQIRGVRQLGIVEAYVHAWFEIHFGRISAKLSLSMSVVCYMPPEQIMSHSVVHTLISWVSGYGRRVRDI